MNPLTILTGRKEKGKIGLLELDARISEEANYSSEVTRFPVESGFSISDHYFKKPIQYNVTGFITNDPVKILGIGKTSPVKNESPIERFILDKEDKTRVEIAKNYLLDLYNKGTLIDIISGIEVYTKMVITSLNIPRSSKTGNTLRFSAVFTKLIKVETEIFEGNISNLDGRAENAENQASTTKDKGTQTTKEVPEEEQENIRQSFWYKISGLGG